eukprot:10857484-Lingulodinium_polyedra.AAC.1
MGHSIVTTKEPTDTLSCAPKLDCATWMANALDDANLLPPSYFLRTSRRPCSHQLSAHLQRTNQKRPPPWRTP